MRFVLAFLCVLLISPASAQLSGGLQFPGPGTVHTTGGGGCSPGTNAQNALNRLSGGVNTAAVCTLINGLDTDSLFAKLDSLYLLATDSSSDALVNVAGLTLSFTGTIALTTLTVTSGPTLFVGQTIYAVGGTALTAGTKITAGTGPTYTINNSQTISVAESMQANCYNAIPSGSPAFSANNGFTGVNASSTVALNTDFIPGGSNAYCGQVYVAHSQHISGWNFTTPEIGQSGSGGAMLGSVSGSSNSTYIFPGYNGSSSASFATQFSTGDLTVAVPSKVGMFTASRTAALQFDAYWNGVNKGSDTSTTESTLLPQQISILAETSGGNPFFGGGYQIGAASIGAGLTGTDATNFYNRMCTYMTTVHGSC